MQRQLTFTVPAMRIAVKSGSRVKKDAGGHTVYDTRIIPKGRPRLGRTRTGASVTFTPDSTSKFEKYIREHFFKKYYREYFFKKYYPEYGVVVRGETQGVHNEFLGCQVLGAKLPCYGYRGCNDFADCKRCRYRRKNLSVNILAFLKDDRHIDGDNILKIVLDAMEGVCYYNDTQFSKKHIQIIPYATEERLEIEFRVRDALVSHGSLIAGYDFKSLPVADAELYAKELLTHMNDVEGQDFIAYLKRRDKRKYVEKL